jgi:homoserine kinase type II
LRAWPTDGPARDQLERVHGWLFKLADLGFIPVPIRDRAGQSLQDLENRLWEIAPWLSGSPDSAHPPDPVHFRKSFEGLAALHQKLECERIEGVSPGLRQRLDTVWHLVQGGFDSLEAALAESSDFGDAHAGPAHRWLNRARKVAPRLIEPLARASALIVALQPCLRDARPEHFLFEGDRLSGVVDFGAMAVESVTADLARLLGEWLDQDARSRGEALAAYGQTCRLEPVEITLIDLFEKTADLLIGERWIRWHFLEHRRFDDSQAISRGLARGLKRVERLADEVKQMPLAE